VLDARVRDGSWDHGLEGEVWMLDGSHSVFGPETIDDTLAARAASLDIHPTGPLWGEGELRCVGRVRDLELTASEPFADLIAGLIDARLKHERRSLRLPVRELAWTWQDNALELRFWLPPGAYATTVLQALGEITDAHAAPAYSDADADASVESAEG
jgi:tRNA pseudouridine13 synthase